MAVLALKVLTKRQAATVRRMSPFLLIAKVTSRQKASGGTSLIVTATMTSLISALRKTAVEAKTAVKKAIAVRVESA